MASGTLRFGRALATLPGRVQLADQEGWQLAEGGFINDARGFKRMKTLLYYCIPELLHYRITVLPHFGYYCIATLMHPAEPNLDHPAEPNLDPNRDTHGNCRNHDFATKNNEYHK